MAMPNLSKKEDKLNFVLLGHNYFSYLLGLHLLNDEEKVMVLKDQNVSYGDEFFKYLFAVDTHFLKSWGELYKIDELKNMKKLLKPCPYYLHLGSTKLYLGQDCRANLIELKRKLPFYFPKELTLEEYDDAEIEDYLKKVADKSLQFKTFANFDNDLFEENVPRNLKEIIEKSYHQYNQVSTQHRNDYFFKRLMSFAFNSFIFHNFSDKLNKTKWGFAVLCLLCKRHVLDCETLTTLMENRFIGENGRLLENENGSWELDKSKKALLSLSEDNTNIVADSLYLMGRAPEGLPFSFSQQKGTYQSYRVKIDSDLSALNSEEVKFPHYVFPENSFGTNVPFFYFYPDTGKGSFLNFPCPIVDGSKGEFFFHEVFKLFSSWLDKVSLSDERKDIQFQEGLITGYQDWIETHDKASITGLLKKARRSKMRLYYNEGFRKRKKVKNLGYWGPLRGYSFGKVSFLMDIKSSLYSTK